MTIDTIALLILIPILYGLFGYMVYKDINPFKEIIGWYRITNNSKNTEGEQ